MRNTQFTELQKHLYPFSRLALQQAPSIGWVSFIRQSLNMTLTQLGSRMGLTKQAVLGLEKREAADSITLKSLKEAARALDMKLIYAIVPVEGDIEHYVEDAARKAARQIVLRTQQHMKLEGQESEQQFIEDTIEEMTLELKRTMDRSIWA